MKLIQDVNKSQALAMLLLLLTLFPKWGLAQDEKSVPYLMIEAPTLSTELNQHSESIQQIIIRAVLITKKFEIIFSEPTKFEQTKLRVYVLKTNVSRSEKSGFYDITMDLTNPKIDKVVRSIQLENIPSKRLLYTIRLMVLQIIFGSKYKEKVGSLEDLQELNIDSPKEEKKEGVPKVNPVEPLPEPVSPKVNIPKKKESADIEASKELRSNQYILGASFQQQSVESSGNLEDTESNSSSIALDLNVQKKIDESKIEKIIFSGRYSHTLSQNYKAAPINWQLGAAYQRTFAPRISWSAGALVDQSHFANRPGLGDNVQIAKLQNLFLDIGTEYRSKIFQRQLLVRFDFLKSLYSMIDFSGVKASEVDSLGYSFFFSIQAIRNYYVGIRITSLAYSISSNSRFSNKDERLGLGIFYPIGN